MCAFTPMAQSCMSATVDYSLAAEQLIKVSGLKFMLQSVSTLCTRRSTNAAVNAKVQAVHS